MNNIKILKAEITNFKNLTHKIVEVNGKSLLVVGANQEGKSSFLQAIFSSFLSTYKPIKPITEGEERGSVSVVLGGELDGEQVEYTVETYFSQEHQKGRLKIMDKDGAVVKSPKSALEQITGDISFDVDRFLALAKTPSGTHSKEGVKRQIDMLKKFMPKEIQKELMKCDIDRKQIVTDRTEKNNQIKFLEEQGKHEFTDEELEKYAELVSTEDIDNKLADFGTEIEKWQDIKSKLEAMEKEVLSFTNVVSEEKSTKDKFDSLQNLTESLDVYKNEQETSTFLVHAHAFKKKLSDKVDYINNSKKEIPKLQEKIDKGTVWLDKNHKPNTEALLDQKKAIEIFNDKAKEVVKIREGHSLITELKKESDKMTTDIEALAKRKKKIFIDHPLPVKGLTFTEEELLYKDLPFNEQQLPTSTIMGVGVQIAMAMNPNLKIIIIRDGSLLDKELYNKILGMIEKKGFQLFIEMVDFNGSELDVKFAEKID